MAKLITNTDNARWTSALDNHSVAQLAWAAVENEQTCSAREQVALVRDDARNIIYSLPASNLTGVIEKLSIWWGDGLWDDDYESSINRMVIGDLRRLELVAAGVAEPEASGRSPQETARLADEWRLALADYNELERLLMEGPSPNLEQPETLTVIDALHAAEGTLLELPAPSVYGVIRKLEILWESDRFEVVEGAFYVHIISDLNRLAPSVTVAMSTPQ